MTRSRKFREIDSLSLLAHKIAPNVFDLSSNQINVSIRDQMVRGEQLVTDLKAAHPEAHAILIVGMGAAGMTAAITACELGFKNVCVVDSAAKPFSLFRGIKTRYVGPYMYEWPSPFYNDQSYPAHSSTPWQAGKRPALQWTAPQPISADQLARELTTGLREWHENRKKKKASRHSRLHLLVSIEKKMVQRFVRDFARTEGIRARVESAQRPEKVRFSEYAQSSKPWPGLLTPPPPMDFAPDYVILAAGMGVETLHIPGVYNKDMSPGFWAADGLKEPGVAQQATVVVGGGDGAIQDSLRALTPYHHPLEFIADLERTPEARAALALQVPMLLSADRQLRQHTSWSRVHSGFMMVDQACRTAAADLASEPNIKQFVLSTLHVGRGIVSHYVRGAHFDKAYLLNRFVIYLIAACVAARGVRNGDRMGFSLRFGVEVRTARPIGPVGKEETKWRIALGPSGAPFKTYKRCYTVDRVVVRFGIHPDSVPGPTLIQFSKRYAGHRTTLNRVELPFITMRE